MQSDKTLSANTLNFLQRNEKTIVSCLSCNRCQITGDCGAKCPMTGHFDWNPGVFTPGNMVALIYGWVKGKIDTDSLNVADKVFTCAVCRHCGFTCITKADIPVLILNARGELAKLNKTPPAIKSFCDTISKSGNVFGLSADLKELWKEEIPFKVPEKETADVVYYLGCQSTFSARISPTTKSMASILHKMKLDWTTLGNDEQCCGFPYYLAGMFDKMKDQAIYHVDLVERKGASTLVTACPGCYRMFKEIYPKLIGRRPNFDVYHPARWISELMDEGKIKLTSLNQKATYHDPCELGRWRGMYENPRKIMRAIFGEDFVDLKFNRDECSCCGGGGLLKAMNGELSSKIAKNKVLEILKYTDAKIAVSACPACEANISEAAEKMGADLKVQDLVELVDSQLVV
ncbi:MAG: (Fe-S)-binding protein [Candidatus Bathyarchaeota archaeon]